ncbi:MAG TPA: archease [Terriglobia bacterium]|nr:archease [Terriglobia bacterium]
MPWEHFSHQADMGIRGRGASREEAFEQAAMALTAVTTPPERVTPATPVQIRLDAPDDELLFADWINALVYEMATRSMLFSRFRVKLQGHTLTADAWGEPVNTKKHQPAVEVKGATYTGLRVQRNLAGEWVAQCVVDV